MILMAKLLNLENLMTSREFRIIRESLTNINLVNLMAKNDVCEGNATGLVITLEDTLEQNF